jgi:hypothetical protein
MTGLTGKIIQYVKQLGNCPYDKLRRVWKGNAHETDFEVCTELVRAGSPSTLDAYIGYER